jgi:acetylornithine deacetylase/succinyl-diaminopimelate desuccinylase-like protein
MNTIDKYIEDNGARFLDELFGLIRIPSVSALQEHRADMMRAAEYWKNLLLESGADRAEIFQTEGNPVTYAEKIIDPSWPTVLVYAHMDVMPADPVSLWISPPFEPEIREGRIYGRGANDDKGQSMIHAKAFEWMVKSGNLPCNVKFMIEGEEEIGSNNLGKFCEENREMLKSDIILVSDTSMIAENIPSITTGLRGLAYWQVEVTGPSRDLHSGLFGGAVANPINELCNIISKMKDEKGRITIPGFYDDVLEVPAGERAMLAGAPFNAAAYMKSLEIEALSGEDGYTATERTGIRPSFDVCGIWGGYTGEGTKTILPSKAYAKISARLVPNQDHLVIGELFANYVKKLTPPGVKTKVIFYHGGKGTVFPVGLPAYHAAEKAFEEVYGKTPVPYRSGGTISIIPAFERILGVKSLLLGFGLESDAIHSPNESFALSQFFNGIKTIAHFYKHFAEMLKSGNRLA